MIRDGFAIDGDDDVTADQLNQLESYRTESGVVINAVRAVQIISEYVAHMHYLQSTCLLDRYCNVLGNGRPCPPRILFHKSSPERFQCILSMPANCPVRDDIIVSAGRIWYSFQTLTLCLA